MPGFEETEKQIRYRVKDPGLFRDGTFRTVEMKGVEGIAMVMGKLKDAPEGKANIMVVQALRFDKDKWDVDKARKWVSEHKFEEQEFDDAAELAAASKPPPDGYELKDVEIFAAGTWNGDEYSTEDLDSMVEHFRELQDRIKPPLKLGHEEGQKLAKDAGFPALGWVTDLRRKGQKLVADIVQVPRLLWESIKKGLYKRISPEIYWDFKEPSSGKVYDRVLKAVALLGADIPAVTILKDVLALAETADVRAYTFGFGDGELGEFKDEDIPKQLLTSDEEAKEMEQVETLQKQLTEKEAELAKLAETAKQAEEATKKLSELEGQLKAAEEAKVEAEAEALKMLDERRKAEVKAFVEKHQSKEDMRFYPKSRELAEWLLLNAPTDGEAHYSEKGNEGEKKLGYRDALMAFVERQPNVATGLFREMAEQGDDVTPTVADEIDALVVKRMTEQREDYGTALKAVVRGRPDLAEKYEDEMAPAQ